MKFRSLPLALTLLLGAASPSFAAGIAYVQSLSESFQACSSTTCTTPSFPSITAGDAAHVMVFFLANTTVTLKDSAGDTFTANGSPTSAGTGWYLADFYGVNLQASNTLTATFGAAPGDVYFAFDEFSGVGSLDAAVAPASVSTANPSQSITTTKANDMIDQMIIRCTAPYTIPSGFTAGAYIDGGNFAYIAKATAGAENVAWTEGACSFNLLSTVAFAPPGVAPKSITISPAAPMLADSAANGATIAAFTVNMSDGSTYNGTNTLLTGSDALCTLPASNNGNVTLSRALTTADVGTHLCRLEATENSASIALDMNFTVAKAVELSDTGFILPGSAGQVLGVTAGGAWAAINQSGGGVSANTIWSGTGAPSSGLGTNGDFYIDVNAHVIYGPKASGVWPSSGTSLIGPAGPQGQTGATGASAGQQGLFTPSSSTMACSQGQSGFDGSYIYACLNTNQWGRLGNGQTSWQTTGW